MMKFIGQFRRRLSPKKIKEYTQRLQEGDESVRPLLSGRRNSSTRDLYFYKFLDMLNRVVQEGVEYAKDSGLSYDESRIGKKIDRSTYITPDDIHDWVHTIAKKIGTNKIGNLVQKRKPLPYDLSYLRENEDWLLNWMRKTLPYEQVDNVNKGYEHIVSDLEKRKPEIPEVSAVRRRLPKEERALLQLSNLDGYPARLYREYIDRITNYKKRF